MDWLKAATDFDSAMSQAFREASGWAPLIVFLVAFTQTGFILGPVLPGSTLLFLAAVLARSEPAAPNPFLLLFSGWSGAYIGCLAHYGQGMWLGDRVFKSGKGLFTQERRASTEEFLATHGAKAMILAPSMPFLRTFSSLAAGMGKMNFKVFALSASAGSLLWVGSMGGAGWFLGAFPWARQAVLGVVILLSIGLFAKAALMIFKKKAAGSEASEPAN